MDYINKILPKSGPNMILYTGKNDNANSNDATRLLLTSNVATQSDGTIAKNTTHKITCGCAQAFFCVSCTRRVGY